VYIVCKDAALRQTLESLIDSAGWHPQGFARPAEFLIHPRESCPSCLVLDASPPGFDGLDLLARPAVDRIDIPIICIMEVGDVSLTVRVMKAGASEVLIKPFDNEALLVAIAQALEQSRSSLTDDVEVRLLRERYQKLSRRERQIITLVVRGRLNKQIAGELGISEITVKAHRGKMMRKMMTRSIAQLVIMYARIAPEP
jgi:FixJ family two-component response regulator